MEINPNTDYETLPEDHPTARVLNEDEKALYWTLAESIQDVVDEIIAHREENGEIDREAPELAEVKKDLQTAMTLANLIEEAAAVRAALLDSESFRHDVVPTTFNADEEAVLDE